jgi:MFS family permease
MTLKTRWRLAAMMGLIYAVQGAYWPLLAVHLADLGIGGRARGWIFSTLAIGTAVVPLVAGQFVDRVMPTQWFLAIMYAVGTGLLVVLASGIISQPTGLFILLLAYWSISGPSYSLSNSLAMRNLADPPREFGWVRLWGTAGWMASGWLVALLMVSWGAAERGGGAFGAIWVAAALSLSVAIYCLTLPHTPPLAVGPRGAQAVRDCIALARQKDIAVLLITSFGVYLTAPLVFQVMPGYLEMRGLPRAWISPTMTLGQMTEIAMLAALPRMLWRIGPKATLGIGIAAWFLRFLSLALDPPVWLAVAGTLTHGVGFACFTVGGQVYMDSRCDDRLRASSQAMLLVCTSGLGALLGNVMAGEITDRTAPGDVLVFLIPCVIDGALLLYFLRGFRAPVRCASWAGAPPANPPSLPPTARGSVARSGHLVTESADG